MRKKTIALSLAFLLGASFQAFAIDYSETIRATDRTNPPSGAGMEIAYDTSAGAGIIEAYDWSNFVYKPLEIRASSIHFKRVGPITDFFIDTAGNLGLGTKPAARLHIAYGHRTVTTETACTDFGPEYDGWQDVDSSTTVNGGDLCFISLFVDSTTGGIGIGQRNPSAQLDVTGTIKATNFVGDGSALTGIAPGVPAGGIIMWSGSVASIPTGWALCDGTNGTPNLTDRFVIGGGGGFTPGNSGGAAVHTHGPGNYTSADHSHTGSLGGPSDSRWVDDNSGGSDHWVSGNNHSHSISTNTGGGGTITGFSSGSGNYPPYLALAYIMKL